MKKETNFLKTVCNIALPVTLQSMLQSSFSAVDQIMIGQLGSTSIAAIGLAGKFSSIFSVVVAAVAAVAGIMIAQYMGKQDEKEVNRSFSINLVVAVGLAAIFTIISAAFATSVMGMYTQDTETKLVAAGYLRIIAFTFIPIAGTTLLSTLFRCMERASFPLYASMVAMLVNTGLNYVLIFGKFGVKPLGVNGAAIATAIAQIANFIFMLVAFIRLYAKQGKKFSFSVALDQTRGRQYLAMLLPILITELLWSLGENVYAAIYGHMGTAECAAMTLTGPIQSLLIGALSGLSQAAAILIGKDLGKKEYDSAYWKAKKLMLYGLGGSVILSLLLVILGRFYVGIYQVEDNVRQIAVQILIAFALISPVKVQNMILGGGIIRSGGKTRYVMWIDIIGTWAFGVPLGLLAAFVLKLSIPYVYFILSLEECVRLLMAVVVFKRKTWMESLKGEEEEYPIEEHCETVLE